MVENKLGYIIYYVKDVKNTLSFYEQAFSLKRRFIHESGVYGELDTGATTLAFASLEMAISNKIGFSERQDNFAPSDMEIGFITSQVKESHNQALQYGAIEVKKPEVKPWGQEVSYVRDLNGFLVEICSPVN